MRKIVQRQVSQPGVLRVPDPVLTSGAPPVPEFRVRELTAHGVRRERGESVAVDVGESQLGARVWSSAANDDRIPSGQSDRSSNPVSSVTQAPSLGSCPAS